MECLTQETRLEPFGLSHQDKIINVHIGGCKGCGTDFVWVDVVVCCKVVLVDRHSAGTRVGVQFVGGVLALWCKGSGLHMARLARRSHAVSVSAVKYGGDSTHPIGNESGNATKGGPVIWGQCHCKLWDVNYVQTYPIEAISYVKLG